MTEDLLGRLKSALADRYQIERELGSGGMATVYLAKDLKHERQVAVKVLRPELAAALGSERFLREIKIAANLNHPHILPLHDSGDADGFLYYVMPYVEGESLRDRLKREKQLPIENALRIASEVADALGFAHDHNVIHRDIKPENILLEAKHAVVADFGVARAIEQAGETRLTETGIAIGTPAYLSPEQASGERELDGRSDIYALGCVLYEMLAGQAPFTGPTAESIVQQHLTAKPHSVAEVRPTVHSEIEAAVSRALAKAPADRFQTGEELVTALSAVSSMPSAATLPGIASRWSHPVAVSGLFGAGAVAVLGVVYLLMMRLGLPDWVLVAAAVLLVVILPFALGTGLVERQRATRTVPTPSSGWGSVAHRWLRWRKAAQGSVIAFVGLGVVTTGYMGMRTLGIGPMGTVMARGVLEEQAEIILADFENRTADSLMGVTITEALRIDLSQSQVVRLVDPATIEAALERMEVDRVALFDDELAREVALREGIKAVIAGEVGQLGQGYMVSARLIAPSDGDVLTAVRERADGDDQLFDTVDRLSRQLRERIGESLRDVRASAPLEQVTTSSLEALRLYTLAWPEQSIELMEEAVRIDSTFAMAYWRLAGQYGNEGRMRERNTAARRAFRYRDRLPLVQRYHVESLYYSYVEGDRDKRISALRSVLELDPYNTSAMNNLGNSLSGLRRFAEAESLYIQARAVRPHHLHFQGTVASQVNQGKYEDADTTLDLFAEHFPGHPGYFRSTIRYAAARHDLETVALYLDSLELTQRESVLWRYRVSVHRTWVALRQGKLSEAEYYLRQATSLQEQRGLLGACLDLAVSHLGRVDIVYRGNPSAAWRKVEEALELYPLDSIAPEARPYENLAIAAAMADRADQARAWLAERVALGESGELGRLRSDQEARVSGYIALAELRPDEAITAYLASHEGFACIICALPAIAQAYDLADLPDSAIVFYERYLTTPWIRRLEEDAWNLPGTLKRLGELYEQRANHENAIHYYNEFVELWQEADPELQPQVEDVRQRIARLMGEP